MPTWENKAIITHSYVKDLNICFWLSEYPYYHKNRPWVWQLWPPNYKVYDHIWGKYFIYFLYLEFSWTLPEFIIPFFYLTALSLRMSLSISLEKDFVAWPAPIVPLLLDCLLIPRIKSKQGTPCSELKLGASIAELRVDQPTSADSGCVGRNTGYYMKVLDLKLFHRCLFH